MRKTVQPAVIDRIPQIYWYYYSGSLSKFKNHWKWFENTTWPKPGKNTVLYFGWFYLGRHHAVDLPTSKMPCDSHISALIPLVPQCVLYCTSYNTIYNSSYIKFGRSHTKAWTWRFQRVKLQGRWSVVLLHSPTLSQQSAATTQLVMYLWIHRQVTSPTNPHTILLSKEWDKKTGSPWKLGKYGRDEIYTVCLRRCLWIWEICWLDFKKWHFSPFRDHFYQLTGSIFERERQMFTTHS